jgi:hypothetical protein
MRRAKTMSIIVRRFKQRFGALAEEAREWAKGKAWQWRVIFLVAFAYVFVRHLADPEYSSVLGGLNLGIHEFGHMVFMWAGRIPGLFSGTFMQLFAPLFGMYNFYRQRDFFSIVLCFGWLSTNFFDVARYSGDARAMNLPLVSPFGMACEHDWNALLTHFRLLQFDGVISSCFWLAAVTSMLACFISGGWLLWQMAKRP